MPERTRGLNAALALAAVRPHEILRITHTRAVRGAIGEMLRMAAARRIPYGQVSDDELARMVESTHHEGICVTARPRRLLDLAQLTQKLTAPEARGALALDHVANPHNLGAIVRSAAYFGLDAVILRANDNGKSPLSPAAVRIAEGGAEHVAIAAVPDMADALRALHARGIEVVGTDARRGESLFARPMRTPSVVVMGSEHAGMTDATRAACHRLVAIPGGGALDSLNVSVAAGVVMAVMAK
jgi:TrmH RNA methyltransferase